MESPKCTVRMLGGLSVCFEGREPTALSRQQTGTLLAYLALYLNRAHTRESLMALIWPDDAQEEASHKLRQSLYALRRQLASPQAAPGDILLTTRTTIQLDPSLVITDVLQFEQSLRTAAQASSNSDKIRLLQEAAGLYSGELLRRDKALSLSIR
jgi:DNA-binding SARP family transcriptional activator